MAGLFKTSKRRAYHSEARLLPRARYVGKVLQHAQKLYRAANSPYFLIYLHLYQTQELISVCTRKNGNPTGTSTTVRNTSQSTVEVYIIDTTSYMSGFPASSFVVPDVPGFDNMDVGSYACLIRHPSPNTKYGTIVFDLGVRKDWENSPEAFVAGVKASGGGIRVDKDVATILRGEWTRLGEVGAIIWSHWHFDHAGDPQTFPPQTDLIIGPGFKANIMPVYPMDKVSHVDERAWQGRELHEIDFTAAEGPQRLQIGGFQAYDFYSDGSFYLLNSPGHAVGHMSALARTTADPPSFMLLGGDITHHCGEFRPTQCTPLPDMISPNPLPHKSSACPGKMFLAIHPKKNGKERFF